ncbi:unnamed protein product [Merluccius merluccius]
MMLSSNSVEVATPGGMSGLNGLSAAARNVVRSSSISGAMYSLEKSPGGSSGGSGGGGSGGGGGGGGGGVGGGGGSADSASLAGNKKRRSSLGAKMVAIVGLSQWSKSTQQLNQQVITAYSLIRRDTRDRIINSLPLHMFIRKTFAQGKGRGHFSQDEAMAPLRRTGKPILGDETRLCSSA